MLFGIVVTELGGVVAKKSAGDGGVSVQKYIYLWSADSHATVGLSPVPHSHPLYLRVCP